MWMRNGVRKRQPTPQRRVIIREVGPRWMLGVSAVVIAMLVAASTWWAYDAGGRNAGFNRTSARDDLARLEGEVADLRKERDALTTSVNAAASDLSVERAAEERLIAQVKTLETENARLKQDLAFFDRILPPSTAQGVSIRSFQIEREAGAEGERLRYRVLLSQGAKATKDFVGQVQFTLIAVQDGHSTQLTIPGENDANNRAFALSFRMFQRVEGVLEVPPGVSARSVQVRVLENGSMRAQQTASVQ